MEKLYAAGKYMYWAILSCVPSQETLIQGQCHCHSLRDCRWSPCYLKVWLLDEEERVRGEGEERGKGRERGRGGRKEGVGEGRGEGACSRPRDLFIHVFILTVTARETRQAPAE